MFTPTTDYNQQMLAYLQTWRQVLEQWTTMAAGLPSPTALFATPLMPPMPQMPQMPPTVPFMPQMPPTVPFMPPMPPSGPVPPAPADYTQQLFSYLQAWRQYLEQMTGATPAVAQPPTAQPAKASENHPADHSGQARPVRSPDVIIPPDKPDVARGVLGSEVRKESNPTWPPLEELAPRSQGGSMVPPEIRVSSANRFNRGREEPSVLKRPDYDFGHQIDRFRRLPDTSGPATSSTPPEASRYREAPAERPVASPFLSAMGRVAPNPSPQFVPKSLFSSSSARTASAGLREAGQTPSR